MKKNNSKLDELNNTAYDKLTKGKYKMNANSIVKTAKLLKVEIYQLEIILRRNKK